MTHPIYDKLPERYHDRVIVDPDGNATITVETGDYTVTVILDADRHAMNLPCGRNHDRHNAK
jgi:hypothetical protein